MAHLGSPLALQMGGDLEAVVAASGYARMLQRLLPPGRLWRLVGDSVLVKALLAAGDELERVDERATALVSESDPRTAVELLPDFETMLELASDGTFAARRARVVAWLLRRQRYRPGDFELALASVLGQDASAVVVIENSRAHAIAVADDREIYRFFIYRDPALPGVYDVAGAQALLDSMKPTHTKGHVIESIDFLCDDPYSLCDRDRLGI